MTIQFDPTVLARLAGWLGVLRPATAPTPGRQRIIRAGSAPEPIEVTVVDHSGTDLRIRTSEERIVSLNGRAVVADFRSGSGVLRLQGSLEMLQVVRDDPPTFVAAIRPFVLPDGLQRRAAVRVATNVAVRLSVAGGGGQRSASTTRDLSTGGARIVTVGEIQVGDVVHLELDLGSGTVHVDGDVLDVTAADTTRIRFHAMAEETKALLERHLAQVPVSHLLDRRA